METFGTTTHHHEHALFSDGERSPVQWNNIRQTTVADGESHYSANITAACQAASRASSRLYCTSKQEKLERRRLSNRRSALRKRVQEQTEIESLEAQIRFLSQANCHLKTEEVRLEQLLRKALSCLHGKRHFQKTTLGGDNIQELFPMASNPARSLQGMSVAAPAVSQFPAPSSFPSSRARTIAQHISQANSDAGVIPWVHPCKQDSFGRPNEMGSAATGFAGQEMLAALEKVVDQSEAKMCDLVTPMATANIKSSGTFPVQGQDTNLPLGELDAVWNILLTRAAQDESFLHFLHSITNSTPQGAICPMVFPDAHSMCSAASQQEMSSSIISQPPSQQIVPLGYSSSSNYQSQFQAEGNKRIDNDHCASADEAPSILSKYVFQFDHKMEPFTTKPPYLLDCAFSDQSSSCSADLDRFLAIDEQLDESFKG